jgi:hypothetical protein
MSRPLAATLALLAFSGAMWALTLVPRVAASNEWPVKHSDVTRWNTIADRGAVSRCLVARGLATRELPHGRLVVVFPGGNTTMLRFFPTIEAAGNEAEAEMKPKGPPVSRNILFASDLLREISRSQYPVLFSCTKP